MAGTSERGHCPECGKRWVRVVESERRANVPSCNGKYDGVGKHRTVSGGMSNDAREKAFLGFLPSCVCNSGPKMSKHGYDPVPDIVLDPFLGSGTVAEVAERLGRGWIGIDLNPAYEPMHAAQDCANGLGARGLMNLHTATYPDCPLCFGHGRVCDTHPDLAWGPGLPAGYFPVNRVCWCGAGARRCPGMPTNHGVEPRRTRRSDLKDMLKWALVAAGITAVFGMVLNVLEAVL